MSKAKAAETVETAEVKHSSMYAKIKYYYDSGFWTKKMVRNAVIKSKITAEEYQEITGDEYEE